LVGVSLIQLASIGRALERLSIAVAPSLGGAESSPAFGLGLIVMFGLTGFMVGYLWTRFYIPAAFERAESDVQSELRALREQADQADRKVEELAAHSGAVLESAASEVRQQVRQTLERLDQQPPEAAAHPASAREQARALAEQYEEVRRAMTSGPARTFEMSRIISRAHTLARTLELAPNEIRDLFREGQGGRVVSLSVIAGKPDPRLVDLVREAISHPASAFEQYQALQAASALVERPDLSETDRHMLRAAIEQQMAPGPDRFITPDTDRFHLANGILARL
jgi:uncharacterized membrane-anchored protein YhcB (DUF1043 family)